MVFLLPLGHFMTGILDRTVNMQPPEEPDKAKPALRKVERKDATTCLPVITRSLIYFQTSGYIAFPYCVS